jgi:hypothetical protein
MTEFPHQGPSPGELPHEGGRAVAVDGGYMGWERSDRPLADLLDIDPESGRPQFDEIYFKTAANQYAIQRHPDAEPGGSQYVLFNWNVNRDRAKKGDEPVFTELPDELLGRTTLQTGTFFDYGESVTGEITSVITAVDTHEGDLEDDLDLYIDGLPTSFVRRDFWQGLKDARPRNPEPDDIEPLPNYADGRPRRWQDMQSMDDWTAQWQLEAGAQPTAANQLIYVAISERVLGMISTRDVSGETTEIPVDALPDDQRAGLPPETTHVRIEGFSRSDYSTGRIDWGDLQVFTRFRERYPVENTPPVEPATLGLEVGNPPISFTITMPSRVVTGASPKGAEVPEEAKLPPRFSITNLEGTSTSPEAFQELVRELADQLESTLQDRPGLQALITPIQGVLAHAAECRQAPDGKWLMTDEQMDIIRTRFLRPLLDDSMRDRPYDSLNWVNRGQS